MLLLLCGLPVIHCWGESLASLVMDDYSDLDQEGVTGETISTWSTPYSPPPLDQCPDLTRKYDDAMVVLKNLQDGMLGDMCDQPECTKVIVTSMGPSAVKQPTRQGLYFLFGWNQQDEGDKYPSYYKPGSKQYLYFMHELQSWEYWHSYDRWIIGPEHNKAIGGIMIQPWDASVVCPWDIKWFRSHRWYHDTNIPNHWNPKGNPWRSDDSIFIHCYKEEDWQQFECGCNNINITSTGRSREYHPDRLGEYTKLEGKHKEGFLAPQYAKVNPGSPSYLFSHHPKGKVWFLGSSTDSWSMRLNKLNSGDDHDCPFEWKEEEEWEYLQSKKGEKEVWLRDTEIKIECLD